MKKWSIFIINLILASSAAAYSKPTGLHNFGATCYLNSTIQCLYNIDSMTNFALFTYRVDPYKTNSLANLYVKLVHAINSLPSQESPHYVTLQKKLWDNQLTKFVHKAWEQMGGCGQQDAPEFFVKLIDSLVADDSRYKASDPQERLRKHPLGKIIKIENVSTLRCPNIHYTSSKQEVLTHLDVEARKVLANGEVKLLSTLEECISNYYTQETLDEYTPEGRPLQHNCIKKLEIAELAEVVIIVPKRFTFDLETFQATKLTHAITIPLTMSFRKYFTSSAQAKKLFKYDLIAAAEHMGGAGGGHYVAHIKEHTTGQWYYCSDETINAETDEAASRAMNKSYVFVYKKNEKKPDLAVEKKRQPVQERQQQETVAQALNELTQALNNLRSVL